MEITRHLYEGKSLSEISHLLKIQYSTTYKYRQRAFEKLGVESLSEMFKLLNLEYG